MQLPTLIAPAQVRPIRTARSQVAYQNRLLSTLLAEAESHIYRYLELTHLRSGKQIYDYDEVLHYIYFPITATISLQSLLEDGLAIEVGIVGREGMVGVQSVLGNSRSANRVVVQSPGSFYRLRADIVKTEFNRARAFQKQCLLYTSTLLNIICQTSACSRRHSVKQRFSRWLLMVEDRVLANEFALTQDFISQLLGSRRASITAVANDLQRMDAIRYSRGHIKILNRQTLQDSACECYTLIKREFDHFLSARHFLISS